MTRFDTWKPSTAGRKRQVRPRRRLVLGAMVTSATQQIYIVDSVNSVAVLGLGIETVGSTRVM